MINYVIWYFGKHKPEKSRLRLHLLDSSQTCQTDKSAGSVQLFVLLGMMEAQSYVFRGLTEKKSTSWHSVNHISTGILTSSQIAFPSVRMKCFAMVLKFICSSAWIVGVGGLKILVILVLTPFVLLKVSCRSFRVSSLSLWVSCAVYGIQCESRINFAVNRCYSEGCFYLFQYRQANWNAKWKLDFYNWTILSLPGFVWMEDENRCSHLILSISERYRSSKR